MMRIVRRKTIWIFIFCFISLIETFAQPSLKTTIDKNEILIGEQVKLKIVATIPQQDFFVKWIDIPDTLLHFELLDKSKIDSTFKNQKLTGLSQTLTFTSFDSGKWVLPAFNIDFNPSNGDSAYNLYTDTFPVSVAYQPDTTNALRDIKEIREVTEEASTWRWVAIGAGIILLILLGAWLFYYLKRKKKAAPIRSVLSPYQMAMQELEQLHSLDLSDVLVVKLYHTRLSEILKQYLSSIHGSYFVSSTTGEVLMLLNQKGIDKTSMSDIAEALRRSDAAKFAKYIPSVDESRTSWDVIKEAINFTEQLQHKKEESGS